MRSTTLRNCPDVLLELSLQYWGNGKEGPGQVCHRRLRMTLPQREELRRVGRENYATAGLVCPVHVKAAFNFELDDIDVDAPLGELLVEASRDSPR